MFDINDSVQCQAAFAFHCLNLSIEEQGLRECEKRRNQSTTDVKDFDSRNRMVKR
jgi:hypothetical protein